MNDERVESDLRKVDPRIPLAAERTLLAWIRTGLSMMALGFVVARFGLFLREMAQIRPAKEAAAQVVRPLHNGPYSVWFGAALIMLGVVINVLAAREHVHYMNDLKRGLIREPRSWSAAVTLTALLAALGIAMTVFLISETP